MKKRFMVSLLLSLASIIFFLNPIIAEDKVYLLVLDYNNITKVMSLQSIDVLYGGVFISQESGEDSYEVSIMAPNGTVYASSFTTSATCIGCPNPELKIISLFLPYFPSAKSIEIKDQKKTKLSIDLRRFCNYDSICESPNESALSCPSDCPTGSRDGICDQILDGRCDLDCGVGADRDCLAPENKNVSLENINSPSEKGNVLKNDSKETPNPVNQPSTFPNNSLIIVLVLVLVIAGVVVLYLRHKKVKPEASLGFEVGGDEGQATARFRGELSIAERFVGKFIRYVK